MKEIKIPFSYCRIDRAARLLECEVDDLMSLGAMHKISLCLNLYRAKSMLYVRSDADSATKWFDSLGSGNLGEGNKITEFSRLHLFSNRYDSDADSICCVEKFEQLIDGGCISKPGLAYGLWRLTNDLDVLQLYGEKEFSWCDLSPCFPESSNPAIQLILLGDADTEQSLDDENVDFNEEEKYNISINDLWVTAYDIRRLLDCSGDYHLLDVSKFDESKLHKVNKDNIPHHSAERHARNREQVLMAALRFKEEQSNVFNDTCRKLDGSINFSAWARELISRPDWFQGTELPIKTETKIADILKSAHKRPSERL